MSPGATAGVWGEAFRVERTGVDARAGLAGAVATCAPLAIGIAAGEPAIGVVACFGGLNAALAVPRGPLRERLGWGVGAALACCLSIALATATQDAALAAVVAAFVWIGLASLLRTFGPKGGLTGFVIGAIFVITAGIPAGALDVGARTLWFVAGSALGVALMTLAYARRGEEAGVPAGAEPAPLRRVLSDGAGALLLTARADGLLRAHALRLATAVALTTLLYRLLELEHGYWIPLTVLAVLQPDEHASRVRALQRAAGTLGGTLAIALLTVATGQQWLMVAAQGLAAFGLFALFARGYFWLVVLLTPTALLTISAVDYQGVGIALERAGWSAAGILVGLAVGELVWRLEPHLGSAWRPARARPDAPG